MSIIGDGVLWGKGSISLVRRIGLITLLREVTRGRPVITIVNNADDPFQRMANILAFDGIKIDSFLNGNGCLTASGQHEGDPRFVHIGKTMQALASLTRHQEGLAKARAALGKSSLLPLIAKPIGMRTVEGVSVFMQSHLDGSVVKAKMLGESAFPEFLRNAAQPLIAMHMETARSDSLADQALFARMRSDLDHFNAMPEASVCIKRALDLVEGWVKTAQPKSVQVHGDYGLQNLLFDKNNEVSAIADWEWVRDQGCAGFDAVHLAILAEADRTGKDIASVAAGVFSGKKVGPVLAAYFDKILPRLGIRPVDYKYLALFVWLVIIFRGGVWTQPTSPDWMGLAIAPMLPEVIRTQ